MCFSTREREREREIEREKRERERRERERERVLLVITIHNGGSRAAPWFAGLLYSKLKFTMLIFVSARFNGPVVLCCAVCCILKSK